MKPVFENILSDGTEMAGAQRYFSWSLNNSGNKFLFSIQKLKGLHVRGMFGIDKYCFIIRIPFAFGETVNTFVDWAILLSR